MGLEYRKLQAGHRGSELGSRLLAWSVLNFTKVSSRTSTFIPTQP